MSERNQIKDRKCKFCEFHVRGKASKMKAHGRECKKTHELAAAQAILEKMNKEMLAGNPLVKMADERVMNGEGD